MSDLESVLVRIEALLRSEGAVDGAAGSAAVNDYIERVEPIALSLARCAAWAQRGLFVEAVSVSDDHPRLAELGRRLLQGELAERVAKRLKPLAPKGRAIPVIDPSWLEVLDRAEADIEREGGLVERHQSLALSRAPIGQRIRAVRALIRSDPASVVWPGELRRVEDGALEELRVGLQQATDRGDAAAVQRIAGEILNDQWTRSVPEDLKKQVRATLASMQARHAQATYRELEGRIREASSRADEHALAELEVEWVSVQQRT
ncbi:MAG: hypothetical protein KGR22_11430, partial [Planctomycetes bacterium]|nr:hypothetical protein [Planctomycetota bacterium]